MTDLDDLGAQRVVVNLFNYFNLNQIDPTLVLWKNEGKIASFLKSGGKVIETDTNLSRLRFLFRLFKYYRLIKNEQPDVVLSFVPATNISYGLIKWLLPRKIKFIACEHAFISSAIKTGEYKGAFKYLYLLLFRYTYNYLADCLIMVAKAARDDAVNLGISSEKIRVIYNPQDLMELNFRASEELDDAWFFDSNNPVIIAVGRLTKQKGFEKLIRAFAILSKNKSCRLAILGRGEMLESLELLVFELGLAGKVRFLGFQINPLKYMKNSSIFVLSSIWEAMPMILAESMAIGTPVVSFNCPSGPFEMLNGGLCGFLVKDQDCLELANTLDMVLDNPEEAALRAKNGLERVSEFDVKNIVVLYQDVIKCVFNENIL